MKNILLVNSSPRGVESTSHQVARTIVDQLAARHSSAHVVVRDLAENPPPHIGKAFVGGAAAPAAQRTAEQAHALALSDALIDEVAAADVLVLAAPMYNFGPPSTLKAWIDHIVRAGRTFTYTATGPQGLLTGKRAILVLARGGTYAEPPMKSFDFQEPYLRAVLGFIGFRDIDVVPVEGVGMSAIGPDKAVASAIDHSQKVLAQVA